ncbi:hypothetical protein BH20ACT23_BH20ACT23_02640 [soil metagenome]
MLGATSNPRCSLSRFNFLAILSVLLVVMGLFSTPVAAAGDGPEVTQLAPSCGGGSSDATFYGNNRRLALSAGGRTLAVYDPHSSGVQLMWKDAGATEWSKQTQGAVSDGQLLGADIPNDRTASVVVDSTGQTGWVVWAGYTFDMISEVRMRRLTDLDAAAGPSVGPEVSLRPGGRGNVRVDAVYHEGSVYVSWTERTGDSAYSLMAARLSDASDSPTLMDVAALWTGGAKVATGTLVSTEAGLRVAARTQKLRIYSHGSGASWTQGSGGASLNGKARPSAIALDSGGILVAAQSDPKNDVVKVYNFTNNGSGSPRVEMTTGTGYAEPTLAHAGGDNALVVMVQNDDTLVSRARLVGSWSAGDTVELSATDGDYAWPNALREPSNGRLQVLVDGQRCPKSAKQQEVLHLSRPLL